MSTEKKAKIIKADKSLQAKAGTGGVPTHIVERAEHAMKNADVDFKPMAEGYLKDLAQALSICKNGQYSDEKEAMGSLAAPIMEMKANAKTFGYELIGKLSNTMLVLIESVESVDSYLLELVTNYYKTQQALIIKGMKGDGGETGQLILIEFHNACERYKKVAKS